MDLTAHIRPKQAFDCAPGGGASPPTGSGRAGRSPARGPAGTTHTVTYPHLRPGRTAELALHAPNAALLIDFDNVTLGIQSDLTKELRTLLNSDIIKGKVAVQRAYADWRRYPQYIAPLSASSIDLIFAPAFGSTKKNATDIRLAIDAIELVFTRPEIGTFIIMSGDSDFSTMVIKLKEYGKYVIGVGIRESASDLLIQNCDEYFSYNDLAGLTKEPEAGTSTRDPWDLAREAVAQMARNGDVMRSDRLKQVMQQIDRNFDEKNAGFSRFSKFVLEAGQKGVLQVTKLDNGQFEVSPAAAAGTTAATSDGRSRTAAAAAAPREPREPREDGARRGRGRGRGRDRGREPAGERTASPDAAPPPVMPTGALTLARAFQLMSDSLAEFRAPVTHEQLRLRMVAMYGKEDALLDTARFGRLLRQANDAEVADVRQVGDDEFEVAAHRRDERARTASRQSSPPNALAPAAESAAAPDATAPSAANGKTAPAPEPEPATASRDAGQQRMGLRFRRGSRGPSRLGDVPLVGMVRSETQSAAADGAAGAPTPMPAEAAALAKTPAAAKPKRKTRAPAKAARAAEPAADDTPRGDEAPAAESKAKAPRRRPRAKAAKKAE